MRTFPESSFFKQQRAPALPTPDAIGALNASITGPLRNNFRRPPPVAIPSMGLFVKYGSKVTIAEAETQAMVYEKLRDQVPVPEVYGWVEDEGQRFIYMSLVEGDTLANMWPSMNEAQRQDVCKELKGMVGAWRALVGHEPDMSQYIGSMGGQPLNEVFLHDDPRLIGPFQGDDAVHDFQAVCDIDIKLDVKPVFTHNDLVPVNIMLTPGPNPKVAAVVDWGQAGWYPDYWEYCKARRVNLLPRQFDTKSQEEWHSRYLPLIIDPVDEEGVYHPWTWFFITKGI
ncbi:hypothetical protein PG984_010461 [Apiospora sp. TS-2023a]